MEIKTMSVGPLGTNCYILHMENKAIIIDPGGNPEQIERFLLDNHLSPIAILLTHAHFDHIGGVDYLREKYSLDVYVHEEEADWLVDSNRNGSSLFIGADITTQEADHFLRPGVLSLAPFSFEIIHTPGHSPGSITFVFAADSLIVSGDVLFHHGIGRTDLPGGNYHVLEDSIKHKLYQLPDHYTVYPGHGPKTTIAEEKKNNPFVLEE